MQICARVVAAGVAFARLIERSKITPVGGVTYDDTPIRGECCAVSCDTCRINAVKHVHTAYGTLHKKIRRTDSHEVTGAILRHPRHNRLNHRIHQLCRLSDREASDSVAWKIKRCHFLRALNAEIFVRSALNNAKQCLVKSLITCLPQPSG